MKAISPTLRKAAILIASLDDRTAERLLELMGDEQAAKVRSASDSLTDIDPLEQRQVLDEFRRANPLVPVDDQAGLELDAGLAAKIAADTYAEPWSRSVPVAESAPTDEVLPFRFLHEAEAPVLARYLEREHPQTMAVVLSNLPPAQAADVLKLLNATLQADVVRRLMDLEATDPTLLREIEQGLERWAHDHVRTAKRREAGLNAVKNILLAAGNGQRVILANVAQHDQQLAGQLGLAREGAVAHSMLQAVTAESDDTSPVDWSFEEVCQLDDAALAAVFQEAGEELTVLAITAAPPALLDRICKRLSSRAARQLRKSLKKLGPTRLSDVEHAQQAVADVAASMAADGRLPAESPRFLAAA